MQESSTYKIQNIVFPTESRHMLCKDLFYRCNQGYLDRDNRVLVLGKGQNCDLITYMNSCSWAKWKKYTHAESVTLHLDIEGECEIQYLGFKIEFRELVRTEFARVKYSGADGKDIVYTYPDNDETIVGVEITAINDCVIRGGYYEVSVSQPLNDVELSLSTTTCKKEDFILKNIKILKNELLSGDDEIRDHLTIHVVDNGRTLNREDIVCENVLLHENPNTGGSGGFARGMLESLHQDKPCTHVLLMDDDVLILPESIKRTYNLLRLLKPEYKSHFINGAMLRYEKPSIQLEDIGTIAPAGNYEPLKPEFDHNSLFCVVNNESGYFSSSNQYSAWWYCCIPIETIKQFGLPLPLFVRGDDAEYSLRCNAQLISMNGICIWHMGFRHKYNGAMDIYQSARNLQIARAASDILKNSNIYGYYHKLFYQKVYKFEYNEMELLIRAFEDYLKGPSFIESADGEAILHDNMLLNDKTVSLSEHPEFRIRFIDSCVFDEPRKFFDKLYMHFTDNGHKFTPSFLYKKGAMPMVEIGMGCPYQKLSRITHYAGINIFNDSMIMRHIDKERYKSLIKRFKAVEKEYKKKGHLIEQEYRKAQPYLTSEEFWRKYLKLQ